MTDIRTYHYVGPKDIREQVADAPRGHALRRPADVLDWMEMSHQALDADHQVIATFTLDVDRVLRVADRHSEHVACAGGGPVLTAGEMTFLVERDEVSVSAVTNQSTGFCPEPESWPSLALAIDRIGLDHPGAWTATIVFRLCESCEERNVVRDGWFECVMCGADLPEMWNFATSS